eukprot:scaffold78855_cov29-Phaeocystis_antarctica.AAC.2
MPLCSSTLASPAARPGSQRAAPQPVTMCLLGGEPGPLGAQPLSRALEVATLQNRRFHRFRPPRRRLLPC